MKFSRFIFKLFLRQFIFINYILFISSLIGTKQKNKLYFFRFKKTRLNLIKNEEQNFRFKF
jgi:hypothetical protein